MHTHFAKFINLPVEHETRLKELLARQAELNAARSISTRGEQQAAVPTDGDAEPGGAGGVRSEDSAPDRANVRAAEAP